MPVTTDALETAARHGASDWVDLLRGRAHAQPDARAYLFLGDDRRDELTYRELDARARAVATVLERLDAAGERILLLYPPGLDFIVGFLGCLYAGAVAVPAYPPRAKRGMPRIEGIVADCDAAIALTVSSTAARLQPLFDEAPAFARLRCIATDTIDERLAMAWHPPAIARESPAFLQYTSGSTGTPRGVVVTHANLLHNAQLTACAMRHTGASVSLSWLPVYHDMGLIAGVLQPLFAGFPGLLMAPASFLQRPIRWLEAISHYRVTTSGGPNFAYELCVRKTTPAQRASLDLSSWTVAFNGAEPIRHETLIAFAEAFADSGFRWQSFFPCYGLAEGTLHVSSNVVGDGPVVCQVSADVLARDATAESPRGGERARVLVGSGRALLDQQIVIADPDSGTSCPDGRIGEIWVCGPSVAHGYWKRPSESAATFGAYVTGTDIGPCLRTGDLGFMLDGQLFVTGRRKDLIIIRGLNHYPDDIERTVEHSHPALRPHAGAAFSVDASGTERLVVVHEREFRDKSDPEAVIAAIRQALALEHELQAYGVVLIKPGTISRTSSGKIQRGATRQALIDGTLEVVASSILEDAYGLDAAGALNRDVLARLDGQRDAVLQRHIQELVAPLVNLPGCAIHLDRPLVQYGLDSLAALELQHKLEIGFSIELPADCIDEQLTVRGLGAIVCAAVASLERDAPHVAGGLGVLVHDS